MESNDAVYLSYKSICLRKSDVNCFQDYQFLNDMCISFYYEILNNRFKQFENNFFLFDPAAISTMLIYDEIEDLIDMYGGLNLDKKDYLFIPINNNTDKYQIAGGDHWALIVYQKLDSTFYYLDSMLSYIKNTDIVTEKIKQILIINSNSGNLNLNNIEKKINNTLKRKFQNNTYDCGMFVLNFTEIIMNYIFNSNHTSKGNLTTNSIDEDTINDLFKANVDQKNIKNFRKQIVKEIEKLRDLTNK